MSLELLQAIAEPTRHAILAMLRDGPLPAGRIAAGFDITRSAVSQHLAVLREVGAVIQEARGTQRIYRIDRANMLRLIDELTGFAGAALAEDSNSERSKAAPVGADSIRGPGTISSPVTATAAGTADRPPSAGADASADVAVAHGSAVPTPAANAAAPSANLDRYVDVEADISVRAEPADVYRCLTDNSVLRQWFAVEATCEPRRGGVLRLSDGRGVVMTGAFEELEPASRVVFSWGGVEGLEVGATRVEVQLRTTATGTEVRLRHSLLPRRLAATYQNVWRHSVLPNLRDVAEGRQPMALCMGIRDSE